MMRILSIAAALALVPGVAEAQQWGEPYDVRSIAVPAADLDLSTRAGERELERRMRRAVDRICGSDRICREGAWASAEGQIAWAIDNDRWMRRLADERLAEIRQCGYQGCWQREVAYYAPPPPPQQSFHHGGTTVTVIVTHAPSTYYRYR
jgi:UrcA family protein